MSTLSVVEFKERLFRQYRRVTVLPEFFDLLDLQIEVYVKNLNDFFESAPNLNSRTTAKEHGWMFYQLRSPVVQEINSSYDTGNYDSGNYDDKGDVIQTPDDVFVRVMRWNFSLEYEDIGFFASLSKRVGDFLDISPHEVGITVTSGNFYQIGISIPNSPLAQSLLVLGLRNNFIYRPLSVELNFTVI